MESAYSFSGIRPLQQVTFVENSTFRTVAGHLLGADVRSTDSRARSLAVVPMYLCVPG